MAATFTPAPGIDEHVARMIASKIEQVTVAARDGVRAAAPPTKEWHDQGDALVRPWHREGDWQKNVPSNLRFPVPHSPRKDVRHYPGVEMLRYPRDPTAYYLQTANCRCFMSEDPQGVARTVDSRPVTITGTRVYGQVVCTHPRAREANDGTAEDPPTFFAQRGAADARARI